MITHFLGPDEVAGYASDLAQRLTALGENFPTVWYLLGKSGQAFGNVLIDAVPPEMHARLRLVRIVVNRDSGRVRFLDAPVRTSKPALLLDSAAHSGKSMLRAAHAIATRGVSDIITYSLVLKRGSVLVPNYFGVVVDETDRCLFQLPAIPNNRLCEASPFGILRELEPADAGKRFIRTGEPAIQGTNFASLLYEKERGSHVYVYEHRGRICGVLSFAERHHSIFIDLVANDIRYRGKGLGAAMMRWAETWARSRKCLSVELWAIRNRIDFYKKRRFEPVGRNIDLGGTIFSLMKRRLLYNLSFVDPLDEPGSFS